MTKPFKPFGVPAHPLAVHLPIALLASVVIWDLIGLASDDDLWARIAHWNLIVGLVAALPAFITGLVDYAALPSASREQDVAMRHAGSVFLALCVFGVSLFFRRASVTSPELDQGLALATAVIGTGLLALGGHIGGTLVYRHGVGVDAEARAPEASDGSSSAPDH